MAMYVDITVKARLKIQDPVPDEKEMESLINGNFDVALMCPFETTLEDFEYIIVDVD
jgi:hypothetical protein